MVRPIRETPILMGKDAKEFKDFTFADFKRVPRNKTAEVKLAKRNKYKPMKIKNCTISLKNGTHGSRPLTEVLYG